LQENPKADAAPSNPKKSKDMFVSDPIVLFDEDKPASDPKNDKFNLANQIPH
jgi:hypothetical protein